jgi:hypothetical protein
MVRVTRPHPLPPQFWDIFGMGWVHNIRKIKVFLKISGLFLPDVCLNKYFQCVLKDWKKILFLKYSDVLYDSSYLKSRSKNYDKWLKHLLVIKPSLFFIFSQKIFCRCRDEIIRED